ncbi:MAG: signal peptidase II [Deltaproteobacteria bacterium]|nr:signal peptidase II [Deltaproteobacteria bacterium]
MIEEQKPESPVDAPGLPSQPTPPTPVAPSPAPRRPSYVLLAIVAGVSLAADLSTKWWALHKLEKIMPGGEAFSQPRDLTPWLSLVLARNRGGAWGLLQTADEKVRLPFFLLISALAILFIVSLYRRVHPQQHALKWGLPLVLGGALGNLIDRIRYQWVIDFIDYRAVWVRHLNEGINKIWHTHAVTDHWPTFNVADIAICIGVGLMAIDMFTSRRIARHAPRALVPAPATPVSATVEPSVPPSQASPPPTSGPGI